MAYTKEQRREYYLKHKKTKRQYNRREKVDDFKIEVNTTKNIAIIKTYLKFRFYEKVAEGKFVYDEKKYIPIQRKIQYALRDFQNIVVIEKGLLQVYIKGVDNRQKAVEILGNLIQEFENEYGREYENVRSRAYFKKNADEDLE